VAHDNPNAMDANNLIDIRARLEQDAHGEAARELIAQFKAAAEPLEDAARARRRAGSRAESLGDAARRQESFPLMPDGPASEGGTRAPGGVRDVCVFPYQPMIGEEHGHWRNYITCESTGTNFNRYRRRHWRHQRHQRGRRWVDQDVTSTVRCQSEGGERSGGCERLGSGVRNDQEHVEARFRHGQGSLTTASAARTHQRLRRT
jgi:hypothetical protein